MAAQDALEDEAVEDDVPEEPADPATDEERTVRARELFTTGVGHSQEQRWSEAVQAFQEALELHPAATIRYNLAAALVELGSVREAHEQLLAVEADPETADNIRELTATLRQRIRAAYGRLRIELVTGLAGATVSLDDDPVSDDMLGTPIPLPDGPHEIVANRDAEAVARASVTTQAGELTHVVLGAAAARVVEPPIVGGEQGTPIVEEPLLWVGIGGGVLLVAGAIILAVVLTSSQGNSMPVAGNFQPGIITWP